MSVPEYVVVSVLLDLELSEAIVIAEAEHVATICERAYFAALDPGLALKLDRDIQRRTEERMLGL